MKAFITNKIFTTVIGVILIFAIWWILSLVFDVNNMVIPNPVETIVAAINLLGKPYTYKSIGFTLLRVLLGFGFSFVLALILGIIAGNFEPFSNVLKPSLVFMKCIPTAAIIFLFAVLVGSQNASTLVTILVSFPILYEAVFNGMKNVPQNVSWAEKIDGANFFKRNFFVHLPLSIPYIVVGILSSFSLSFKVEIMSEIISGSTNHGIGSAIKGAINADATNMLDVFAYSLITILIVIIITSIALILKKILSNKFPTLEDIKIL